MAECRTGSLEIPTAPESYAGIPRLPNAIYGNTCPIRNSAKFSRQMPVGDSFYADFLCRRYRLIIELDGFSHDVDPGGDFWRDKLLNEAGFRVLHFSNAEVLGNTEGVLTSIRIALGNRPTPDPSRKREGSRGVSPDRIAE